MSEIDTKEIIGVVLTVWANVVATIALVHELKKDKKKAAPPKPHKRKRKR